MNYRRFALAALIGFGALLALGTTTTAQAQPGEQFVYGEATRVGLKTQCYIDLVAQCGDTFHDGTLIVKNTTDQWVRYGIGANAVNGAAGPDECGEVPPPDPFGTGAEGCTNCSCLIFQGNLELAPGEEWQAGCNLPCGLLRPLPPNTCPACDCTEGGEPTMNGCGNISFDCNPGSIGAFCTVVAAAVTAKATSADGVDWNDLSIPRPVPLTTRSQCSGTCAPDRDSCRLCQ